MQAMDDACVDMICCDLPYGTTQNKWDAVVPFDPMWSEYRRIIKKGGAIALTATQPFSSLLIASNLPMFKYEWIWRKSKVTGHLNAKKAPMRQHESILIFCNGQTTYNPQGLTPFGKMSGGANTYSKNWGQVKPKGVTEFTGYPRSVIEFDSEAKTVHPTQKPVTLMEYLIRTYTSEGDAVLDNCMGSGTTGVACINTGRKFIGIEKDAGYFNIAADRISAAREGLGLFAVAAE
jgi:site-specific DNA-methyltransferase (adenine-specific)